MFCDVLLERGLSQPWSAARAALALPAAPGMLLPSWGSVIADCGVTPKQQG